MTTKEHMTKFLKALRGGQGELDAWLECNSEAECKAAINGALEDAEEALHIKQQQVLVLGRKIERLEAELESVRASDNALIFKALAQLELTTRGNTDLHKELHQRAKGSATSQPPTPRACDDERSC